MEGHIIKLISKCQYPDKDSEISISQKKKTFSIQNG